MLPYSEFKVGSIDGHARPGRSDRVSLCFGYGSENFTTLNMSSAEARAMANALYEASDAAELLLPVEKAAAA